MRSDGGRCLVRVAVGICFEVRVCVVRAVVDMCVEARV